MSQDTSEPSAAPIGLTDVKKTDTELWKDRP
jgi:hypothetical protein